MYRWLLDTNIIISGLFWSGNESELLKLGIANKYKAVVCEFVLQETERIVAEKFPKMAEKVQTALDMLVDSSEIYPLLQQDKVIEFKTKHGEIITDKNDLVILATAFEAGVDMIVTGDKHFYNLEVRKLVDVIDAGQALEKINDRDKK
jgi:uncharacterized protein